ncbi:class I SAM-dependent DNA methyltransferase [Streptomyces genisteinicus]|uniref:Class I SAM-dependent methyltransferase n=1 Tax=Streptomyces genisteinicus TaxID=2768068 RepID=A0A7H0I4W5_9ACTN|nr:class I SAM-dependent methyltransferase [Streptomyces genisteinicus]QNP67831.1 class I SAM-dependent methyltransferase [Streptomyces genisteinicus]
MYGAEFAEIYDLIHQGRGKDYALEAQFVAGLAREKAPGATSLLDVACATGSHLAAFADIFDTVAGVELSEPMVEVARRKLGDTVHVGDMRDFDLGARYSVVTCMFGSIGHAMTEPELVAALRRFEAHLEDGGVIAVDPWWFDDTFTPGHVSGDVCTVDGLTMARVSHASREDDKSRMDVHYTVARPHEGVRHFVETYRARLYTREQYEKAFAEAGLAAEYVPEVQGGRGLFLAVRA